MVFGEASWLHLEPRTGETLRRALERTLRDAILAGILRPGVILPSSRALAATLGVSRGVTTEAYGQLQAQGFLISRTTAPPMVADLHRPSPALRISETTATPPRYDFSPTTPSVGLFPARRWTATLLDVMRAVPNAAFDYGNPQGQRELRRVLADHLGRTRGVIIDPAQIVIVQGVAQGIGVLTRLLAARGAHHLAVEDPGLDSQRQRIREHGLRLIGQPVDEHGLTIDGLNADGVVVTPAHQFPTGAVLSGARRRALLAWAHQHDALVIEDDYDAEYRYDQQPVRALQGLDPEQVAYLGTASKTLAPALRLGWLALPGTLVDDAVRIKHLLDVCSPSIDQLTLAQFIARGHYDRHIRHARSTYRKRRDRLLDALTNHIPQLQVDGIAAGMHVLLRLTPGRHDDRAVATEAAHCGVHVTPLSTYQLTPPNRPGLVLGYGRIPDDELEPAVTALAHALHKSELRHSP